MKCILPLIISISLLTGCGKLDQMGENAEAAKDNSGRAADAAGESREEIAYSRMMGRSGATSAARRKALESMVKMTSFEMKVTEAAKYLKAFEFQLWTGQRYDSPKYLDTLKTDAVNEFFRSTVEVYGDKSIIDAELNPIRLDRDQKDLDLNVMAMGVALHQIHAVQEHVTVEDNSTLRESESMLSIIKEALLKIEKVKKAEVPYSALKEHEQAVYNYRKEALTLLKGRVDMLMVMSLAKVSSLKDSTLAGAALSFIKSSFQTRYFDMEIGRQKEVNRYMAEARATAEFLESIGEKINSEAKVRRVFEKMEFPRKRNLNRMALKAMGQLEVQNHTEFLGSLEYFFHVKDGYLELKK